jgi:transcriptional regulator with XRE-family HTH domain
MDKNSLLETLGARIRSLRKARGYSQEELAFKANLARGYYGEIERGERNVAILNLYRIAKALDVDIKEIFDT